MAEPTPTGNVLDPDVFNEHHPVGTRVLAFPGSREGRAILTTTRSTAWRVGPEPVVMVNGYSGGIALTHIEVIPDAADPTPERGDVSSEPTAEGLTEAVDRFLAKTMRAPSGCLIWIAAVSDRGYGLFSLAGKMLPAHRFSHMAFVGEIPDGYQVDHLCRRRRCVEPMHLQAVTPRINTMRGMGPTARNATAEKCPQGHPYSDENTYRHRGKRYCRICQRERRRERDKARVLTPEQKARKRAWMAEYAKRKKGAGA